MGLRVEIAPGVPLQATRLGVLRMKWFRILFTVAVALFAVVAGSWIGVACSLLAAATFGVADMRGRRG